MQLIVSHCIKLPLVFVFKSCKFICNISPRLGYSEILHIKRVIGSLVVLFIAILIQVLLYLLLMKSGVLKILVQFLHLSIFLNFFLTYILLSSNCSKTFKLQTCIVTETERKWHETAQILYCPTNELNYINSMVIKNTLKM